MFFDRTAAVNNKEPGKPFFHVLKLKEQKTEKFKKVEWYVDFLFGELKMKDYYNYTGTLTTPPCTEVTWLVFEQPQYIDDANYAELQRFMVSGT